MELVAFDDLYYSLWEISCRFSELSAFRVIGRSHDGRLIPMVEIGHGGTIVYCVSGMEAGDYALSCLFPQLIRSYCLAYEEDWQMQHFYSVRRLLQDGKLLFIPVLNPDGYEICRCGYSALRNPAYRQELRSSGVATWQNYDGNARGILLDQCFLTDEGTIPENENRAMRKLLQEFAGDGLLRFCGIKTPSLDGHLGFCGKKISSFAGRSHFFGKKKSSNIGISACKEHISIANRRKNRYLLRGMKQVPTISRLSKHANLRLEAYAEGTLERYYSDVTGMPSVRIYLPESPDSSLDRMEGYPLEGLFSLEEL